MQPEHRLPARANKTRLGVVTLVAAALALLFCGVLAWDLYRYASVETYLDHAEPSVAARAWRLATDMPLYLPADDVFHQRTAYGPGLFLAIYSALAAAGPSILASKLASVVAALCTPLLFFVATWRRYGTGLALVGTAGLLALQLAGGATSIWIRSDPLLVLATTAGLAAALWPHRREPSWGTWIAAGICGGAAATLKIHAFVYFLPLALGYLTHRWWLAWPVTGVTGLIVALLPFAIPGIAPADYLAHLLGVVGGRGIELELLRNSAPRLGMYLGPAIFAIVGLLVAGIRLERNDWLYFAGLSAAGLFYLYPASVPGGAWGQMIPLAPFAIDLALRLLNRFEDRRKTLMVTAMAILIGLSLTVSSTQRRLQRAWPELADKAAAADDARQVMASAARPIAMGYGADNTSNYRLTYAAPLLAFAGDPPLVLGDYAMEATATGATPSPAKLAALRSCAIGTWMIERDSKPFALRNFMIAGPAFWPEWQDAFAETYEKTSTVGAFDLWTCRQGQQTPDN